ncbi:thrombospondin type 3 repeat-containing protein [Cystobacter ferrugineus]|uniref:thrombospondin type 3 repeat-containing protein n=1 Tax=Cystobacter ferrugineus TaxID=83449 RepID=UPI000A01E5E5|nr:thrombospondin type 3 repeat-containing protein [Cystobacter ferrugineus]
MRRLFATALLLLGTSCVSGNKVRADSEVIQASVERARRSGAMRCAPVELAVAEANLDFARGELSQGASYRASEHIRTAESAIKRALDLSKDCAPPRVVYGKDQPEAQEQTPADATSPSRPQQQVVVQIEEKDTDGDGVPDKDDPCADRAEDFDGFEDADGCPEPDNDGDGVLDGNDKCPLTPGPLSNQGCPQEAGTDSDSDGIPDDLDKCPLQPEDKDGHEDSDGCPDLDNDNDGLLDNADKCPDAAGPIQSLGCPRTDKDGDGIDDAQDKCPDESEDKDGFQDEDGCPDLDNDNDSIPDAIDRCPLAAGPLEGGGCPDADKDGDGTMDRTDLCPDQPGPQEMRGCPDPDKDGDGIVDRLDICPEQPGPHETRGCPDADKDNDGLIDRLDVCPDQAGTQELRGCPDPDRDMDGIPDRIDVCADDPGVKEERGCPKKYKMVVVKRDKIEIKKQIKFASGSAKIIGKESFTILDDVAQVLRDMPTIKKIRIEGHTDSVGKAVNNMKLSQSRADAVMAQLLKRGIDPGRMQAVGYGMEKPIASNLTAKGRAENRRTEFNIVDQ